MTAIAISPSTSARFYGSPSTTPMARWSRLSSSIRLRTWARLCDGAGVWQAKL